MRVGLSLCLGCFAAAAPADDCVGRETDENQDSEGRQVDGWTGVGGDNRGRQDRGAHGVFFRAVGFAGPSRRALLAADSVAVSSCDVSAEGREPAAGGGRGGVEGERERGRSGCEQLVRDASGQSQSGGAGREAAGIRNEGE